MAMEVGSVCPKVAHAHLLKDEAEGLELVFECIGINAHSSYGNGRVAKKYFIDMII